MVRRCAAVLLAVLLWGCPDDIGGGGGVAVTGLRAPEDLKGVPNGGSEIVLTWKDRATTETGYRVEMNPVPFGSPAIGGVAYLPANATSAIYPAVPNSRYFFRVFAITAVMESDPSTVVEVSTPNVPDRPTDVVGRTLGPLQIGVRWSDVTGENGYRVEISSDGGAAWNPSAMAGADATNVEIAGLVPDSEYVVRVVAFNAQGDSTPSLPVHVGTLSTLVSFAVASGANTGSFTSYHLGANGVEHLSHFDSANSDVLQTTRPISGAYATVTVDRGPTGLQSVGGDGTSIAVDGAGKVHIAAHDQTSDRIRYISNASGAWAATTLDAAPGGARPRIVFEPASASLFLYYLGFQLGTRVIKQAWKPSGKPWILRDAVPIAMDHETTFSLAIDAEGTRHIALITEIPEVFHYWDPGLPQSTAAVSLFSRISVPGLPSAPDATAISAGPKGLHVFFHDAATGSLYHAANASGDWQIETVEGSGGHDVGSFCSAAVHSTSGRVHVAYYDATTRDLKYARKDPGGSWVRKVLDVQGDVGAHASIAIDAAGAVHIAYRDETNKQLKVATGTP